MKPQPVYDVSRDTWYPHLCPFGDDCSKCDVDGYCAKGRTSAAEVAPMSAEVDGE